MSATGLGQEFKTPVGAVQVIKGASLTIQENTITILYGPSGSGKSTLLNILSGLQKPTTGSVLVKNRAMYEQSSENLAVFRARNIGIIYQTNHWITGLSVLENVALPLNFLGDTARRARDIAMDTLRKVGMEQYAHKDPLVLSKGEQQRIAIARALVTSPLIIVADEPTGNLDVENGNKIIELLQTYRDESNCTVILVTHNIEYLAAADKLYCIKDGIVNESDVESVRRSTEELMDNFKNRLKSRAQTRHAS